MLDLFCDCGSESEATMHYLLLCSTYQNERLTIVSKKFEKNIAILDKDNFLNTKILFHGNLSLDDVTNTFIITYTIQYVLATKPFNVPLFKATLSL